MPRVLMLNAGLSLEEAMRAFRHTRSEFAVVVHQDGEDADPDGTVIPGSQTLSAEVRTAVTRRRCTVAKA